MLSGEIALKNNHYYYYYYYFRDMRIMHLSTLTSVLLFIPNVSPLGCCDEVLNDRIIYFDSAKHYTVSLCKTQQ